MDQEEEELPPLQAQGVSRDQFLQDRIDYFGREVAAATRKINRLGDMILPLIGVAERQAEYKALVIERDAQVTQQAASETQQKLAVAQLAGTMQPDWFHKAFEGLTLKVDELAEKVDNATRPLPKAVGDNLTKMLFAVLDKNAKDDTSRNPVGVSFFVRPTLAVTAFHVLSTHYSKTIAIGAKVYLSREAGLPDNWITGNEETVDGPNLIETTLAKFDKEEDWALLELAKSTENIIPFEIAKAAEAKDGACQMLNFNIHLTSADAASLPQISMSRADFRNCSAQLLTYTCTAYSGDSGGAVVVSKTGKVVAMHCELVSGMKDTERKKYKMLNDAAKELNDFHSDVSSGHAQAVFKGIRLDYLEEKGHFAGF
ncbi:hypothetical protein BASA81_001496 [Batrachochytrium salamandrivorans]|nr:hypothetical protein BASA81_001496 [Batrachochytrium salamandrivorans]